MPNTSLPGDFGSGFVSRPNIKCSLGQWYCCELMVKANTVGSRDGRIACWLDGVLIADFTNLRLRDVDSLKINRFNLSLHAGTNTTRETWKWYDNVVAATSYIGPLSSSGALRFQANHTIGLYKPSLSGTTISFSLADPSPVVVTMHTAQGTTLKTLANKVFSAGTHRICWNGCDGSGAPVAKGLYLARVRAADREWTARMTLPGQ
jgi:hypothetical protein